MATYRTRIDLRLILNRLKYTPAGDGSFVLETRDEFVERIVESLPAYESGFITRESDEPLSTRIPVRSKEDEAKAAAEAAAAKAQKKEEAAELRRSERAAVKSAIKSEVKTAVKDAVDSVITAAVSKAVKAKVDDAVAETTKKVSKRPVTAIGVGTKAAAVRFLRMNCGTECSAMTPMQIRQVAKAYGVEFPNWLAKEDEGEKEKEKRRGRKRKVKSKE